MKKIIFCLIFMLFAGMGFVQAEEDRDLDFARNAFNDGFYDVARQHFEKILFRYGPEAEQTALIHLMIGRCWYYQGRWNKALYEMDQARAGFGRGKIEDEIDFWTAEVYYKVNDYRNALVYYQRLIENFKASRYLSQSGYSAAWCLMKQERFKEAMDGFKEFIRQYPSDVLVEEAQGKISECLYSLGQYESARENLLDLLKKYPLSKNAGRVYFLLGEVYYYLNNYPEAVKNYERSLEIAPESDTAAYALYGIGWTNYQQNKLAESIQAFRNFSQKYPYHCLYPAVLYRTAEAMKKKGAYDAAIDKYDELVARYPDNEFSDDACMARGQCLYELKRYDAAIYNYRSFMRKYPKSDLLDTAHYYLGWTYLRLDENAQAIGEFQNVAEHAKDGLLRVSALCRVGDTYLLTRDYLRARESYDFILKNYPDNFYTDYAQYQLGMVFLGEAKLDAAILAFQNLGKNFPRSKLLVHAQYQLGMIYISRGDYQAAEYYLNGLDDKTGDAELKLNILLAQANVDYNSGDFKEAIKIYKQVLARFHKPEHGWRARYELAWCYVRLGKEKQAQQAFTRILDKLEDVGMRTTALFWLGEFFNSRRQFDKASVFFKEIINNFPQSDLADDALYWWGLNLYDAGRMDEAIKLLTLLETRYPLSDLLLEAKIKTADIYVAAGDTERAREIYKSIIVKSRRTLYEKIAQAKMADIYMGYKKYNSALFHLKQAFHENNDDLNAMARFKIAQCYEGLGQYFEAREEYLKVGYQYPEDKYWRGRAYTRIAQLYEQEADWPQAQSAYQKIIDNNLGDIKYAQGRMEWIKQNKESKAQR